jgi:predicted enzyme related to lactoylglutathione lyase
MLRGFTTITYWTTDLEAAKKWYSEVLGVAPYFERGDAYAEFRIGDYQHELGLLDSRYAPEGTVIEPGGQIVYWAVDDIEASYQRLQDLGAKPHDPPTVRGDGYVTASVIDPFGNILGIMYNVHYLDVLAGRG